MTTVKVEDFDHFLATLSTKGAETRKQHGSRGSRVFPDPTDDARVWVVFDWDEEGYQSLLSDPGVPHLRGSWPPGSTRAAELAEEHEV